VAFGGSDPSYIELTFARHASRETDLKANESPCKFEAGLAASKFKFGRCREECRRNNANAESPHIADRSWIIDAVAARCPRCALRSVFPREDGSGRGWSDLCPHERGWRRQTAAAGDDPSWPGGKSFLVFAVPCVLSGKADHPLRSAQFSRNALTPPYVSPQRRRSASLRP
jgi:hypothetical protein